METVLILLIITAILEVLLHIASVFFVGKKAAIASYVNIGLHIAMFFELMAYRVKIEVLALAFLLSLLVYLSISFFFHKKRSAAGKKEGGK